MTTNLVVADLTRTEKTICLAVTPALKAYGILGRARLFEVIQKVREINAQPVSYTHLVAELSAAMPCPDLRQVRALPHRAGSAGSAH